MQALEIENLQKTYPSGHRALKGVSLGVREGEFFALLGPNGAGKSTLIGIVTSLVRKSGGKVRVFGHDIDRDPAQAKAALGLVPQEINFNQWDRPLDIVAYQAGYYGIPRQVALPRVEGLLRQLGLWEKRLGPARELSGGMKRRLMIARALVHRPRLLILDEPTAGVDIELRRSMWDFLRSINSEGTSIILTTHYLEEAESLCESIAIIDQGALVADTDMKSLLNRLHAETFVLDLARAMPTAPVLTGYVVRYLDEFTIEVEVNRDSSVNDLFTQLSDQGVRVLSMRNKANRLEELFIRMVGQGQGPMDRPGLEPMAS